MTRQQVAAIIVASCASRSPSSQSSHCGEMQFSSSITSTVCIYGRNHHAKAQSSELSQSWPRFRPLPRLNELTILLASSLSEPQHPLRQLLQRCTQSRRCDSPLLLITTVITPGINHITVINAASFAGAIRMQLSQPCPEL